VPDAIHDVAVIGAGWAGCAAAVELCNQGQKVLLLDAAPQVGGRARHQSIDFGPGYQASLDNGQHLLIGAYSECLSLIALVGGEALERTPLTLLAENGIALRSTHRPTLPALLQRGLAFAAARGIRWQDKIAIARAIARLNGSLSLGGRTWDQLCIAGETVTQLLQRLKQPKSITDIFWNPLCVATMNTPSATADAATFCRVLRDSLGSKDSKASDFLTPASHLGATFPDAAAHWLTAQGADIQLRTSVTQLERDPSSRQWTINHRWRAKKIIIATPPSNAARLLAPIAKSSICDLLQAFRYQPIATVYLGWKTLNREDFKPLPSMFMLTEDMAKNRPGQWLFSRGLHQCEHGLLAVGAVVISAWNTDSSTSDLLLNVQTQISSLANLPLPKPDFVKAIIEKRATLECTPHRPQITANSLTDNDGTAGIFLAGDYCYADYPATLEGAVRSGQIAARHVMKS
jgi:hydroxysqualene dehydroxylase